MLFVKFKFLSKIKLYLFISLSVTTNYFLKQYSGHLSDLDLHIIWTQETIVFIFDICFISQWQCRLYEIYSCYCS